MRRLAILLLATLCLVHVRAIQNIQGKRLERPETRFAEAKRSNKNLEAGKNHHRVLPHEFLRRISHLHQKPLRNAVKKNVWNQEKHTKFVKKFNEEHVQQPVQKNKKEEVSRSPYSFTRGAKRLGHTSAVIKKAAVAAAASKALGSEKVQEAIVDKGIEVVGNAIDKQIANIEGAQNKSEAFLNQRIRLDISPEKGWENEDMFVPPGYHINAEVANEGSSEKSQEQGEPVYTYPAGIGSVMMNGCWGTGYQEGDPCYQSLGVLTACQNMIDGAAFIGVGFDGRGKYSPESRKMSIIQRSCGGRSYYDDFQVPDTMNVHGIYETSSNMRVFSSRREYQSHLQTESGASGSFFGFYAGVKAAYGSSFSSNQQTNLAVFDIDIDRYEIFKDEVKPQDLSRSFLHEFMNLPESYFQPGAPVKFNDFISRWGTHYIKSAKFGGQLEIRKLQSGTSTASKEEFAVEAETEYRGLFASAGAYHSTSGGSQEKTENKFMSTSVQALGGDQRIAAAVTDLYMPTFKATLVEWLDSINNYPKAFKFIMGSITDLVDFRVADLFPDEEANDWGCEANQRSLEKDASSGKYYYNKTVEGGGSKKIFCDFASRDELEIKLKQRRSSLKAAIQAYMEEGPISATELSISAGDGGCETQDLEGSLAIPNWTDIATNEEVFHVIFDMDTELRGKFNIPKSMSRLVRRRFFWWITANENGKFRLFNGFANGGSSSLPNEKISIFGLVLTYEESSGTLTLASADYNESSNYFTNMDEQMRGKALARVEWPASTLFSRMTSDTTTLHTPCNIEWSNAFRFDPNDRSSDKCVHFTAFAKGTVYIIFSSIPTKKETWYSIEISKYGVVIYKGDAMLDYTTNQNAVSIGSRNLYQTYYACLTETESSTIIEYGKTQANSDFGDNYLTTTDRTNPIHARFYAFGNGEDDVQIMDIKVTPRSSLVQQCKAGSTLDAAGHFCARKPCHEACDQIEGCRPPAGDMPLASECYACQYARQGQNCVMECLSGMAPNKNKICSRNYDLTFKTNHRDNSSVVVPSTLSSFTICLWIKFPTYQSGYLNKEYRILGYYPSGFNAFSDAQFQLSVRYEEAHKPTLVFTSYFWYEFFLSDSRRIKLQAMENVDSSQWHTVCITRESSSGNTHLFWHGDELISGSKFLLPGKTIKKGGIIQLAGLARRDFNELSTRITTNLPVRISQVNVWNRVLTNDETAALATRQNCDGASGNVLDWQDFRTGLTLSKFIESDPSECSRASSRELMF